MSTRVGRSSRLIPLYHQVYLHLRDMISSPAMAPDQPLPSEPHLAARFGVSRVTLRATLARLEAEGLVRRVHGVGTFPVATPNRDRANIQGHLENLMSFEAATTVRNLEWSTDAEPDAIAARALGESRCVRIVRVRSYQDQPISFTTICVASMHARLISLPPPGNAPVIRTLEEHGVMARDAEQVLTAIAAPVQAAQHLNVGVGTPLIAMRRLMLDHHGKPILHQESLYVPDRFEYRMKLSRTSVGPVAKWAPIG